MQKFTIDADGLTLAELRQIWEHPASLSLGDRALERITAARTKVDAVVASGERVYGLNTGFGQLAHVQISNDELALLFDTGGNG